MARGPGCRTVGAVVGSFKSAASKRARQQGILDDASLWQRNYYEHVIRNEDSLNRIREYIMDSPLRWKLDRENPRRTDEDEFDRWLAAFRSRPVGATHASPANMDKKGQML